PRFRRLHQAGQPDHRGRESHGACRGPDARQEGRARSRADAEGARRRAGRVEVPRSEGAQLHRQLVQARVQDRSPLQGPRSHHGVRPRARCAGAGHGHRPGAVQCAPRQGTRRTRSFGRHHAAGRSSGRVRVGAALAVTWGAVGLLGPVAVLTNYQNQKIGQQLILAVEEFFEENKTALQGVVTYPTSPKHLLLYSKFGYRPKGLVAITSRLLDRRDGRTSTPRPPKAGLIVKRFSSLEEAKKKAALARFHKITTSVCRGLDLAKEVEIVDGLALGDTLLFERGRDFVGFAVYHTPGVSEAPAGAL